MRVSVASICFQVAPPSSDRKNPMLVLNETRCALLPFATAIDARPGMRGTAPPVSSFQVTPPTSDLYMEVPVGPWERCVPAGPPPPPSPPGGTTGRRTGDGAG